MVKILSYAVTGQRIEVTETAMLVAGTVNVYTARFAFGAEWDGLQRTAVFAVDGITREQLLEDDACTVPWEVLVAGNRLRVGVYGTKADGTRLPTIWTERRLYINPGAGPTQEAADPSPTLVEQLLGRIGDPANLKTEDKSSLVAAINEIWMSGGSGGASVTDAAINEDGHLIITLSTGKDIDAGRAVGAAGAGGKSAYEYAVDGGYTGTEAEFAAKLAAEIPAVDDTLTASGKAADAAAVGARLSSLSEEMLTEESDPTVPSWAKAAQKPSYTASEVGADPSGTAASQVSAHNTGTDTHSDIRLLIQGLSERLSAVADSDDTTLDQLSEIVAYIKSNRDLISAITTDKVSVADIIDNLTTNVANKPLSAAQGVALKALIDAIIVPDKLPNPNALTFSGAVAGTYDGSVPLEVAIPGGGRTLELIADVTTSEETNMISINKDLNGNAFTIRDYALRITIPAHTRSERATFYARAATYGGGLTFTNMLVTDGAEIGFFVYPIASYDALDLLDGSSPVKVQSISSRGSNSHESANGFSAEVSQFQVYTNSTTVLFPAGVNVQVYGVRK